MESPDVADFADITVPTGLTVPSAPTGLTGLAVPSAPMALKVFVRKIGEKKSVVAIVAPEGAAPERTMESLLATLPVTPFRLPWTPARLPPPRKQLLPFRRLH